MKAYKQISFRNEKRWVWSYTALLALIGFFMMLRPVFAQEKDNDPEIRIDIQKEYDEQGNLLRMDSTKTWIWSGREYSTDEFDSIWKEMGWDFTPFHPHKFVPFGFNGTPPPPAMHHFWKWNGEDSTAYSYFNDLFKDDFADSPGLNLAFPFQWVQPGNSFWQDSMGYSPFSHAEMDALLNERMKDLQERIEKYQQEHRQLLEKYFREPSRGENSGVETLPNLYMPVPEPARSGKI